MLNVEIEIKLIAVFVPIFLFSAFIWIFMDWTRFVHKRTSFKCIKSKNRRRQVLSFVWLWIFLSGQAPEFKTLFLNSELYTTNYCFLSYKLKVFWIWIVSFCFDSFEMFLLEFLRKNTVLMFLCTSLVVSL